VQKRAGLAYLPKPMIKFINMDQAFYLEHFQNAAAKIDREILVQQQLEVATQLYGDAVCLKLYKLRWASPAQDPLTAETRIFFSIWISNEAEREQKLLYNIHAFKLRKLKGYAIESRKFADIFRSSFKQYEHKWQNVSTEFGPLTLMQGWVKLNKEEIEDDIMKLSNNFFEIEHLIDSAISTFKK